VFVINVVPTRPWFSIRAVLSVNRDARLTTGVRSSPEESEWTAWPVKVDLSIVLAGGWRDRERGRESDSIETVTR